MTDWMIYNAVYGAQSTAWPKTSSSLPATLNQDQKSLADRWLLEADLRPVQRGSDSTILLPHKNEKLRQIIENKNSRAEKPTTTTPSIPCIKLEKTCFINQDT